MSNRLILLMALLLSLVTGNTQSADIVTNCFQQGALGNCSGQVLQHVEFKSVVLQFVDPANTKLGEGLARIYWREVLDSISDLPKAGVILAYDRDGDIETALGEANLGEFLQREYHDAALAIALQQQAKMAIWGAVLPDGDQIYVQTFLTLQQSENEPWTTISVAPKQSAGVRLSAPLSRNRLNLPALIRSRESLFHRWFVTRCALSAGCPNGVELRAEPSSTANVVAHVPEGNQIEVTDMQNQWMKVRSSDRDGQDQWINIYHLEMFPETVQFENRKNVNLRAGPNGEKLDSVNLNGQYRVLNAVRYGPYKEPWYQIEINGRKGWIAGRLVQYRSYIFSGVHLIAGLYRYGRGDYAGAGNELRAFLAETPEEDNVTRAVAFRFLAASQLAGTNVHSEKVKNALKNIGTAIELTPFDASGYTFRALVNAGSAEQLTPAIDDLKQALKLNRRDENALQLLESMNLIYNKVDDVTFGPGRTEPLIKIELDKLAKSYLKEPGSG
ncbi:MAG: SH3 domain-containing protein [Lysobacterales bacterium]